MMAQRHHRLRARHRLLPVAAANSGMIAVIAATTTLVGATSPLQIAKSALEPSMPVLPLHLAEQTLRQRRHRLLPVAAADSGMIAVIAATTTVVGATSLPQIAKSALEPSMPARPRHLAEVHDDCCDCGSTACPCP